MLTVAIVLNPRSLTRGTAVPWQRAREALRQGATVCGEVETRGDGRDAGRIERLIRDGHPEVVIAAGGDGTVNEVAQSLVALNSEAAPALGMVPLGTANNVARSLGLRSCRQEGIDAVDCAAAAVLEGVRRRIDLGQVGGRHFVGSFAAGMDADILTTRNRVQRRLRLGPSIGGYPLYLLSCGLNLLRNRHTAAQLRIDGADTSANVCNLLVLNTALYAGEFRFDAADASDDGRLDLHLFSGAADYVRGFVGAWRRHLRYERGEVVEPPRLRRAREIIVELESPLASQLDGEEREHMNRYEIRVVPGALTVCVPAGR